MDYLARKPYNVIIIGAGSGIGRAAAEFLAGQGASIASLDSNAEAAVATAKTIAANGQQGFAVPVDITEADKVETAMAEVEKRVGQIHALVNCAGITGRTNIKGHEVELEDFDRVYRINLRGALIASQAVLRRMLPHNFGRILHVASIAGKEGNAGMTAYSATKAGLIGLVKSLGKDYAETGITINSLAPAVVRTPLVDALPDATVKYMTDKIPMRRCGELDEVAAMIAWIVSPACSFTTGFTFDLSGGRATY
ncbi:MAG: 2-dehydro-3-deoxy-L-rhamnonate dehydrogenase [Rhodospirillaceae bacterium]|nr:2-dehydro-3-deoxy-L-rhamnonate dehydrogenase [Rhodospirillaceae bacterium]